MAYEPLNIPNFARVWTDIADGKSDFPRCPKIAPTFQQLKEFVVKYFEGLNGVTRAFKNDDNILTMSVLLMVENMVRLGFFQNDKEYKAVMIPILSLLDGSNDFMSEEEEQIFQDRVAKKEKANRQADLPRYDNTETNRLMIDIKKKIIEILFLVMSL